MTRLKFVQTDIEQTTMEQTNTNITESDKINEIPSIRFNSKLDGLDEKVLSLKLRKYSNDFKQSLDQILDLYPIDKLKYSSHLVSFVMHEVERFLLKKKSGTAKRQLVIDCVKKYFDDNEQIVGVVIDLLFKDLKQVRLIKRNLFKIARFFFNRTQNQ